MRESRRAPRRTAASRHAGRARGQVAKWAALLILLVACLFPFYWMAVSSLKTEGTLFSRRLELVPRTVSFGFYSRLMQTRFLRYFLNSTKVALVTTAFIIVVSVFAAYALARFKFPGRDYVATFQLVGQMIPGVLMAVPLFMLMVKLKLFGKHGALVLSYTTFGTPFCTWMLRGYFASIPHELEEAALIDGCDRLGALLRVVIPLSSPGIAATAAQAFLLSWNEYTFASIFINSDELKTLPVGLSGYISPFFIDYGVLMAGAVLSSIPAIVFFLAVQRYIVQGLTAGAAKG